MIHRSIIIIVRHGLQLHHLRIWKSLLFSLNTCFALAQKSWLSLNDSCFSTGVFKRKVQRLHRLFVCCFCLCSIFKGSVLTLIISFTNADTVKKIRTLFFRPILSFTRLMTTVVTALLAYQHPSISTYCSFVLFSSTLLPLFKQLELGVLVWTLTSRHHANTHRVEDRTRIHYAFIFALPSRMRYLTTLRKFFNQPVAICSKICHVQTFTVHPNLTF